MAQEPNQPEKPKLPSDEDIQSRFQKIRDELKDMDLPHLPDDEDLRKKIDQVNAPSSVSRMPEVPHIEINRPQKPATNGTPGNYNYRGLGIGMSAAYSLVGSMIVGFGLGWAFDKLTHNNYGQAIGALLGSVLGIASAIFLINRDGGTK